MSKLATFWDATKNYGRKLVDDTQYLAQPAMDALGMRGAVAAPQQPLQAAPPPQYMPPQPEPQQPQMLQPPPLSDETLLYKAQQMHPGLRVLGQIGDAMRPLPTRRPQYAYGNDNVSGPTTIGIRG
jgi:hypothetical protein